MSDMEDKEKDRRTRTERELDALGEGTSAPVKPKPKEKPKAKPKEKAGIGRDHSEENKQRLLADLDARIRAARAAGNQDLVNKYTTRRKALEAL